jgi:hypothetical protein
MASSLERRRRLDLAETTSVPAADDTVLLGSGSAGNRQLSILQRFARRRKAGERCELCSAPLDAEHDHLLELKAGQLVCACQACAILFSAQQTARYRRIPQQVRFLPGFVMTDETWNSLNIPITLAFFVRSTPAGKVLAMYPSPGGATAAEIAPEEWEALVIANPTLKELRPDVEALLVNRIAAQREYYLAPLDQCYRLVGLIRRHWRGLSGGAEVWGRIAEFFATLKERSDADGEQRA